MKEELTNQATQAVADTTIAAAGSKATYAGAGMTIGGWFLSNEFAVLGGLVIGIAGLIINWYYRHKEDKRQQALHEIQMDEYRKRQEKDDAQ